jgi:hypothetical protein
MIKTIRIGTGERLPLLVRRSTGVAVESATYWLVSERRVMNHQAATLEQDLRDLMLFYLWGEARGFDPVGSQGEARSIRD